MVVFAVDCHDVVVLLWTVKAWLCCCGLSWRGCVAVDCHDVVVFAVDCHDVVVLLWTVMAWLC